MYCMYVCMLILHAYQHNAVENTFSIVHYVPLLLCLSWKERAERLVAQSELIRIEAFPALRLQLVVALVES